MKRTILRNTSTDKFAYQTSAWSLRKERATCSGAWLLDTPKQLDLLNLRLRECAWNLATGQLLALDLTAYALDDLGIGKRRDVSHIGKVGDRSKDPAHDLARAGLGHIRDDPAILRSRDLPDLRLNRPGHLLLNLLTRLDPGLQGNVHLNDPTAELVQQRDRGSLGDLFDGEARRLNLFRSEPVPGHIDHIIDPAKDAEITVAGQHPTLTRAINPPTP